MTYIRPVDDRSWINARFDQVRSQIEELRRRRSSSAATVPVTYTSSSLADGASETGFMDLGTGFSILHFEASDAARFRVYQSVAHRTADLSRPVGVLPTGDHGLIFEDDGGAPIVYALGDAAVGGLLDGETLTPVTVTNMSGSTRVVTVTLEVRR